MFAEHGNQFSVVSGSYQKTLLALGKVMWPAAGDGGACVLWRGRCLFCVWVSWSSPGLKLYVTFSPQAVHTLL